MCDDKFDAIYKLKLLKTFEESPFLLEAEALVEELRILARKSERELTSQQFYVFFS